MNSIVSAFFPLLILLVIIFLYVIGFKRFKQNNGIEGTGPNGESPYGVFGVLGFFVFSSYYIAPLYVFGNTAKNLQKVELDYPAILELPGYGTYKICVYLLVFGMIFWQIQVAKGLRKNLVPSSLKNAKILCFAGPWLAAIADALFASVTMSVPPNGDSIGTYLGGIITSGAWGIYFVVSKRCKNTYLTSNSTDIA